jgi:hypothetical protein
MAWTIKLLPKKCAKCPKRASVEVFNDYGATMGYFCAPHGKAVINDLEKSRAYSYLRRDP